MPAPYLLLEEPKSYQKDDIFDFFGIPPAPESDLEQNIKAKRKFWGNRANGVAGREQAQKIKKWIQELSKILEDGAFPDEPIVHTDGGGFKVVGEPTSPQELSEQLELFLRQGDVANVLRLARLAMDRWPGDEQVLLFLALALTELLRDHFDHVSGEWRTIADDITMRALNAAPNNPDVWNARARFALATNNLAELGALDSRAQAQGVSLPAEVYGSIAAAAFRSGNTDAGVRQLIRQVIVSDGDPAVRSVATETMLNQVVLPILPILDRKSANAYVEAVEVLAWLAEGVAEWQSELLGHRLWAKQSVSGVFTGDVALKSFLGILTGFIALPMYSRGMSSAGWRILRNGPRDKRTHLQFDQMMVTTLIQEVHGRSTRKFEWQAQPGEPWPEVGEGWKMIQSNGFTRNNITVQK